MLANKTPEARRNRGAGKPTKDAAKRPICHAPPEEPVLVRAGVQEAAAD